jgi:serine/threonine protein kinase
MSIIDGTATTARRYRILSVVAEGGYGRVYRARLEGADGFSRDVAIKLMRPGLPDELVARFRDEVRMMGLIRDRAIVSVEPLTWLEGRPALVMDYADGRSASRLLQEVGCFPPTVALELVEEVARVLDVVFQQAGPDGRPLQLIHRDLKPGNLQVAPSGAVRVLDFGIASTESNRDNDSDGLVIGTAAYIAPERFEGIEGPEADIYSLGVLLRTLVTGQSPDAKGRVPLQDHPELQTPEIAQVLRVADLLADPNPQHRPGARRVEELCRDLEKKLDGPTLRQWAMHNVFPADGAEEDTLVGQVLTEGYPEPGPLSRTARALAVVGVIAVLVAATFGVAAWFSSPHEDTAVLADVAIVPTHSVTFSSNPTGANVAIDGVPSGTTPLDRELDDGPHLVRVWTDNGEIERQILVSGHSPARYVWDGGEAWRALY